MRTLFLLALAVAVGDSGIPEEVAIDYAHTWAETTRFIRQGKFDEVWPRLSELMVSALYENVPSEARHSQLLKAAQLGQSQGDFKHAHPLYVAASELPEAAREDWDGRYEVALRLRDMQDATYALATLARRWPASLDEYNDRPIRRLAMGSGASKADEETRLQLLQALFAAKWTANYGVEPSELWQELTRILVERGDTKAAAETSARITYPRSVLALRIDGRFDAIVRANSSRFELNALVDRELTDWREIAARNPTRLEPLTVLAARAVDFGRYDEALALTNGVLAKVAAQKSPKTLYEDFDEKISWVRDARAHALLGLGQWNEAERELRRAASLPENGQQNVSSAINLALYEVRMGRATEAVNALGSRLSRGENVSEYGAMQVQYVLHAAAIEKKNAQGARTALAYMREHQNDALDTFQEALLFANALDEAAALLVRRLEDRELRSDALLQIQEYRELPYPSGEQRLRDAWRVLRKRDDVQAAVAKVGKIEQIPLPP